jgi:exopolysaccharide production protein ExoQ
MWAKHWWMPNQAHNGFIEIYLNLGRIGLLMIVGILISYYLKSMRTLSRDYEFGLLKMAFLFIILIFSQFEAAFKGLHIMWFLLLLFSFEYGAGERKSERQYESAEGG